MKSGIRVSLTGSDGLTQRIRKLIGTVGLIATLVAYPWLGMIVYETAFTGAPRLALLAYFVIAGLLWAVPAGVIIKWMSRPDETAP
jgi:hypothetical protein